MLHGAPWRVTKGAAPDAVKAARPVLNGEDEETGCKVLRLVLTQHRDAVEVCARAKRHPGQVGHPLHDRLHSLCEMDRGWVALAGVRGQCTASGGREAARPPYPPWRRDQHRGQKRGDGIGYSGHKHQKGEKVIAIIDNHGSVLAPVPVAPVNEIDMVLLPEGLKALKRVAKEVGLDLRGAYLNLDGGFDSTRNRKCIFNAGLIPNIKENPRNRKATKRGRKRLFNAAIHALRMRVERTFAWEEKFKRLLLRFESIQQRHYGMKVMAYTLINLRAFCGV
jgi:Transposase DDE domain